MTPDPVPSAEVRQEAGLAPPAPAGSRWRHAARFVAAWWLSPEWPVAWALLVAMVALGLGGVYLAVWLNGWQQQFFDAVAQRRAVALPGLIAAFAMVTGAEVALIVVQSYLRQTLGLRWRAFLSRRYVARWLSGDRYHEIERRRLIDNPDQRISDDIRDLSLYLPGILIALFTSSVSAFSFMIVLLGTAQAIRFTLFGHAVAIPGDMPIYGTLYAVAGSVAMVLIGRPYLRRYQRQQHREGDFRAGLVHVRRNAAQIGFARTAPVERASLDQAFDGVRRNYRRVILSSLGLTAGQGLYERFTAILPLFFTVPRFLAGQISFGQVMASRDAFATLVQNLSFFIQSYPQLAQQIANLNRLRGLDEAIDDMRPRGISLAAAPSGDVVIAAAKLEVRRPSGGPLLAVGDWQVRRGERWAVWGASGAGKSTLLRAVAGLWPDGSGTVAMAPAAAMFVPQRLYLPTGTLKDAVCFPDVAAVHADAAVLALLDEVGLAAHADGLHRLRWWQDELSPGEQQRLALARILLHRPALLILDEATGALDPGNAHDFYRRMLAMRPDLTLVSIVHDDRLLPLHTHWLRLDGGRAVPSPYPEAA